MTAGRLATPQQVASRLGRPLTDLEQGKVEALITDASSSVINYSGQQFVSSTSTQLLPIRNRGVKLPQLPVTAVATVIDQFGNSLPFIWIPGDDVLTLASATWVNSFELNLLPWTRVSKVSVTYTHGYAIVPDDVIGVVCQIVGRALGSPAFDSGLQSESIGSYSYQRSADSAAGPWGLLPEEKQILDGYRVLAGPALML